MSVELRGAHVGGGCTYPAGRARLSRGRLAEFQTLTPSLPDDILPENHAPEGFIPFGLRLIFLFYETLK